MRSGSRFNGAYGPSFLEIGREHPRRHRCPLAKRRDSRAPGHYRRLDKSIVTRPTSRKLADILVHAERPRGAVRTAGLDDARNGVGARFCPHAQNIPAFMNGAGRGNAAARRSARLPTDAQLLRSASRR